MSWVCSIFILLHIQIAASFFHTVGSCVHRTTALFSQTSFFICFRLLLRPGLSICLQTVYADQQIFYFAAKWVSYIEANESVILSIKLVGIDFWVTGLRNQNEDAKCRLIRPGCSPVARQGRPSSSLLVFHEAKSTDITCAFVINFRTRMNRPQQTSNDSPARPIRKLINCLWDIFFVRSSLRDVSRFLCKSAWLLNI